MPRTSPPGRLSAAGGLRLARVMGTVGLVVLGGSCGEADPPRFVSLEIWEGYVASPGVPVLQRRVGQTADGGFDLRRDTLHVARVTVRTSGQADRCLFRPFFYSWMLPSRDYECYPEVQDGPMTIDVAFGTREGDVARATDHYLIVQLYELGADRELIGIHDPQRFPVRFLDATAAEEPR